ncbi:MAG: D-2-hydroxyacid dehydrogenase [Burkholderiales bacterium]
MTIDTTVLVIDPDADFFRDKLLAEFPGIKVLTALGPQDVGDKIVAVDVLAAMGSKMIFREGLLEPARKLKWIQTFTTGTDKVTPLKAFRKDMLLTSTSGMHGAQMAEMALMQMLALARDLPRMLRNQAESKWDRFLQIRLLGKTVVILGVGTSGENLALRCKAMGMKVIGVTGTPRAAPNFDHMVKRSDLPLVAKEADFLVVVVPYEKETHKIVNAAVFNAMKPTAFVCNIARGGVLDEQDLLKAIQTKQIAGAALDVFDLEPLPPDNPLWREANIIITPHHAGQSDVYNEQVYDIFGPNLKCFLEGRIGDMRNVIKH